RVAAVLAINRLCPPGSKLAVERHWYPSTALDDLLHIGKKQDQRYAAVSCLDCLLPLKSKVEQHLKQRYGELFQAEFDPSGPGDRRQINNNGARPVKKLICCGQTTRESIEAALRVIQRGHRPDNDRRVRDLVAVHQQARRRAAEHT